MSNHTERLEHICRYVCAMWALARLTDDIVIDSAGLFSNCTPVRKVLASILIEYVGTQFSLPRSNVVLYVRV